MEKVGKSIIFGDLYNRMADGGMAEVAETLCFCGVFWYKYKEKEP